MARETTLRKALEDFTKNNPRKQLLAKNYDAFQHIAEAILSGYFEVKEGSTPVKFVKPTKVEFYYHEEYAIPDRSVKENQNKEYATLNDVQKEEIEKELTLLYNDTPIDEKLLIKDFIVYHRNKPKNLPFEDRKFTPEQPATLFKTPGILNNHQSGIDITFEHEITVNDKIVNVRASALIRGFYAYENEIDCREMKLLADSEDKTIYADDRSTYLYDHLYGSSSVLDGVSVQWKDNEGPMLNSSKIESAPRTNVYQYEHSEKWQDSNAAKDDDFVIKKVKDGEPITSRKYVPDERKLQFYNKEYYK